MTSHIPGVAIPCLDVAVFAAVNVEIYHLMSPVWFLSPRNPGAKSGEAGRCARVGVGLAFHPFVKRGQRRTVPGNVAPLAIVRAGQEDLKFIAVLAALFCLPVGVGC